MDYQILQLARILSVFIASFAVAIFIKPIIYDLLLRYGFKKQIRDALEAPVFAEMHKKKSGTPTGGGVIIWLPVLIVAFIFFVADIIYPDGYLKISFIDRAQTYLPFFALICASLLGMLDDVLGILRIGPKGGGLSMSHKLIAYLILSFFGGLWFYLRLDWDIVRVPFLGDYNLGWYYVPFFMFIITGTANAVNLTDGLDGLAGGVMLFCFMSFVVIAFLLGRYDLAAFSVAIIGGLLAFLWFNIHPAKFFMGDTGSMALGITLATIALLTNSALLLPLIAFVPLVETLSVIVQLTSKKIFKKKIFISTPIHHHFEAIQWEETQIVMRFWIITAVSCALGMIIFFLDRFLI